MPHLLYGAIGFDVSVLLSAGDVITGTHTHTRSVCEGLLLTAYPKLNYNHSHHVLNFEDVPLSPVPFLRTFITFL